MYKLTLGDIFPLPRQHRVPEAAFLAASESIENGLPATRLAYLSAAAAVPAPGSIYVVVVVAEDCEDGRQQLKRQRKCLRSRLLPLLLLLLLFCSTHGDKDIAAKRRCGSTATNAISASQDLLLHWLSDEDTIL